MTMQRSCVLLCYLVSVASLELDNQRSAVPSHSKPLAKLFVASNLAAGFQAPGVRPSGRSGMGPSSRAYREPVMQGKTPEFLELVKTKVEGFVKEQRVENRLKELPNEVQPWVQTYSARPWLFAGDFIGLLVAASLNPIVAFPFWLAYFGAAHPLGKEESVPGNAYSGDATKGYNQVLHNLGPAWAAGTLGGLLLSAPFEGEPGPFTIFAWLGSAIATFICLSAPRAYQVYLNTGKLPDVENEAYKPIKKKLEAQLKELEQ